MESSNTPTAKCGEISFKASVESGDSGVDLTSDDETQHKHKSGIRSSNGSDLDPSAMSHVKPAPKACLTSKVNALSDITRESLYSSAQQVIDDLNSKRKQDSQLLADFKEALQTQVVSGCDRMQQYLYNGYEKQGEVIQQKLQELYVCLDRIEKIETELLQFRDALKVLYQDMHQD